MPLFLGVPGMARFLQVEVLPRVFTGSKTLAYDAIGNPTSDGTWTYAWQAGRQLKSMSKSGTSVTYKYDHNGLRVQKVETSGTKVTTTAYTLNGNRVVYAKVTEKTDGTTTATNTMYFYYDAQGRPAKVNFWDTGTVLLSHSSSAQANTGTVLLSGTRRRAGNRKSLCDALSSRTLH